MSVAAGLGRVLLLRPSRVCTGVLASLETTGNDQPSQHTSQRKNRSVRRALQHLLYMISEEKSALTKGTSPFPSLTTFSYSRRHGPFSVTHDGPRGVSAAGPAGSGGRSHLQGRAETLPKELMRKSQVILGFPSAFWMHLPASPQVCGSYLVVTLVTRSKCRCDKFPAEMRCRPFQLHSLCSHRLIFTFFLDLTLSLGKSEYGKQLTT